jgi:tRNA 2-thiouridine synthesizing protein A
MEATVKADQTLDCTELLCPGPIIKIGKAIKTIGIGQVIELLTTDPGSVPDIQAWARQTGNELVSTKQEDGTYRFFLRRLK